MSRRMLNTETSAPQPGSLLTQFTIPGSRSDRESGCATKGRVALVCVGIVVCKAG